MVLTKTVRVWRKYRPRSVLVESKEVPDEALLFESNTVAVLSTVELEIIRKECSYGDSLSAYGCLGVLSVDHEQETFHYLVVITECQPLGKLQDAEAYRITQTAFIPLTLQSKIERVTEVGKLLASGKFYFSYPSHGADFDLLCCAQKQGKEQTQTQFHWNRGLTVYLERFGVSCSKWLFRVMCGHVDIQTLYAGEKKAKMVLISRISCERAGTRLNVRGMNDEGHVANFVETELAIYCDNNIASFVQVRGLVPLFWEQPGIQTSGGLIRIKLSRGYACSHSSFERHFEWSLLHYGPLLCLNLLGQRNQEAMLSRAFQDHFNELSSAYCAEMLCFDYHRQIKSGGSVEGTLTQSLFPLITPFTTSHGFFVSEDGRQTRLQTGTMRINCLDCLDRTNSVQNFVGQQLLPELLASLNVSLKPTLLTRFRQLLVTAWTKNGDSLSLFYSGTRALSFEGKKNKLKGGARSVQRTIRNNFMDSNKQEAIDMLLLGNVYSGSLGQKTRALLDQSDAFSPVPFRSGMCERWSDFTSAEKLRVAIGTWNVNGGKLINSIALRGSQSLDDWLLDGPKISGVTAKYPDEFITPPDIYVIGFEEMVGLTASNIVSASSSNRREWAAELQKVLSRDTPYELLTSEQLVGVCLYIFIRPKHIPYVRDVAVSSVKTGMSGNVGNKGGVAIRLLLHSTSMCFVCSHFAAHQNKVLERNHDFNEICRKVSFPHGQTIDLHDYVFWCGDLNYRVDLPTSAAKDYISHSRWDKLTKQDQLFKQKRDKKVFQGYIEGDLTFAPTYKYDQFSDDYDTSEKCRTPAWCDRVLWRRQAPGGGDPKTLSRPLMSDQANADLLTSIDFGLHPCDANMVCGGELMGELVSTGHKWHPGRLLYYNRAELKQSDHRPVMALIEVDIYRVDASKRGRVRDEVILALGPLDPTVVIQEQDEGGDVSVTHLLEALRTYGEVVLVRVTDESVLVTFKKSTSALAATGLHGKEVHGVCVSVNLREPWPPGSEVTTTQKSGPRRASRRPTVSVLTSELLGVESGGGDNGEDLVSFSFDDQSDTKTQDTASANSAIIDDDDTFEIDPDTPEPEIVEPELNPSSSDSDNEATVGRSMKHTRSEPIIPNRPVPSKRPNIPPRPNASTASLQEVPPRPSLPPQPSLDASRPIPKPRSKPAFTVGGPQTDGSGPQSLTPELTRANCSPESPKRPNRSPEPPKRPNRSPEPPKRPSRSPEPPKRPSRPPPPSLNGKTDRVTTSDPLSPYHSVAQATPPKRPPTVPKRPEAPRPVRPPPPKKM